MAKYAVVENDEVVNIVVWDGNEDDWQPLEGCLAIEVPENVVVSIGFVYVDGAFSAPELPTPPAPTAEQVLAQRDSLLATAALRIAPLQDAAELGIATPNETAALKIWRAYRVALNRIESSDGFPASLVWPTPP